MIDLKEKAKEINSLLKKRTEELKLTFEEDTHKYEMLDVNGNLKNNFPSVSKLLKNFYPEFPKEEKALAMANGDIEEKNRLLAEWEEKGRKSTYLGSRAHYELEKYLISLYGGYKDVRKPIFECDNEQILASDKMIEAGKKYIDLMHERGCVLLDTEIVLGDPELGYTGQPDKTWLCLSKDKENFGLITTDWKTNLEKNFIVQRYNKDHLYKPFDKYINYALTHYYLQLPFYARLLIKMLKGTEYENLKSLGGVIVLLKRDQTFNEYRVPTDIQEKVFNLKMKNYV